MLLFPSMLYHRARAEFGVGEFERRTDNTGLLMAVKMAGDAEADKVVGFHDSSGFALLDILCQVRTACCVKDDRQ